MSGPWRIQAGGASDSMSADDPAGAKGAAQIQTSVRLDPEMWAALQCDFRC
jgi:hypothetical protein